MDEINAMFAQLHKAHVKAIKALEAQVTTLAAQIMALENGNRAPPGVVDELAQLLATVEPAPSGTG